MLDIFNIELSAEVTCCRYPRFQKKLKEFVSWYRASKFFLIFSCLSNCFDKKDNEVSGDLVQNQKLSTNYKDEFPPDDTNCHCNCKNNPEMSVHAATMLAQVGKVPRIKNYGIKTT